MVEAVKVVVAGHSDTQQGNTRCSNTQHKTVLNVVILEEIGGLHVGLEQGAKKVNQEKEGKPDDDDKQEERVADESHRVSQGVERTPHVLERVEDADCSGVWCHI